MIDAPDGAVFVWCNGVLGYPRALAQKLSRLDLRIKSPDWLEFDAKGTTRIIILDHACELTDRQLLAYRLSQRHA